MATNQGKATIRKNRKVTVKKHDGQNEPKEQPEPPLKERVRMHVRTHQKQVASSVALNLCRCEQG
jgi:hypothetical protein